MFKKVSYNVDLLGFCVIKFNRKAGKTRRDRSRARFETGKF